MEPVFWSVDISSPLSDTDSFRWRGNLPETSSSSSRGTHSDEVVILASSRPKKRGGRKKFKETRHPVYRGVRRRNLNKWVCELREPIKKSRIWLGTYPTAEMAARAHDVAALALRGKMACLNFADSVWRLPAPASKDPKDIRKAAAEAAQAFRPIECEHQLREEKTINSYEVNKSALAGAEAQGESDKMMTDEGAMFDMPNLLANLADGILLSPPYYPEEEFGYDDVESEAEVSLWSF